MAPPPEGAAAQDLERALVVDLDGTLLRTDLLHECFWRLAGRRPFHAFRLALTHLGDRAALKVALAEAAEPNAEAPPVNEAVAGLLRDAKAQGRPVLVATAAEQALAEAIVARVAPGVEVLGTTPGRNLKGVAKAAALVERYGAGGFDYVGDSAADLSIWPQAARAIAVRPSARIARVLAGRSGGFEIIEEGPRASALWRALRPHQWVKNVLVFGPALAAHDLSAKTLALGLLAFVAFSLCASAIYVINDLLDLEADRRHPTKRARPFASGAAPIQLAGPLSLGLLAAAFLLAAFAGGAFFACLAAYLVATTAYSARLKRELFADAVTLGGLYTLRVIAGAAATGIVLSPWLLACSGFGFLALAIVKRQTELRRGLAQGLDAAAGRAYTAEHLPMLAALGAASAFAAVVVFALYVNTAAAQGLYSAPEALWAVCPLLIYWLGRMLLLADRGEIDDDPIVFALEDKVSLGVGAAVTLCFLAASTL